jgi:hypothetical protein
MGILFTDRINIRIIAFLAYSVSAFSFFVLRQNSIQEEAAYANWVLSTLIVFSIVILARTSGRLTFSNPIRRRYFEPGTSHHRRVFVIQSVWGIILCFPSNLLVNVINQDYFFQRIDLWTAFFVWCASLIFLSDSVLIAVQKWSNTNE